MKKKWNWSFFFFSLSAGKLTARCSGNFKLLPRLPVRVGWTLELEDIHGESFGEWSLNFFLSPSPLFAQRILKYNSTFVIFPSFRLFIYLFFEDRVFFRAFPYTNLFLPRILIRTTFYILPNYGTFLYPPVSSVWINIHINFSRSWRRSIRKNSRFEHFSPQHRVSTSNNPPRLLPPSYFRLWISIPRLNVARNFLPRFLTLDPDPVREREGEGSEVAFLFTCKFYACIPLFPGSIAPKCGSLAVEMRATETVDTVLRASVARLEQRRRRRRRVGVSRVCDAGNTPNSPRPLHPQSLPLAP